MPRLGGPAQSWLIDGRIFSCGVDLNGHLPTNAASQPAFPLHAAAEFITLPEQNGLAELGSFGGRTPFKSFKASPGADDLNALALERSNGTLHALS